MNLADVKALRSSLRERAVIWSPLKDGARILETDAPPRATIFGGGLDMTGEADLSGHRILVVEDDYYLASDTARAVRGAGAQVLGPCPSEQAACNEIGGAPPTAAVVDINLGGGPSFKLARLLKERGIPVVFLTGYDEAVIPAEFSDVPLLQKPVELRQIVNSLAKTLGSVH
jgi:CheY-like chemotaxis protein